jgi:hypothetical protein
MSHMVYKYSSIARPLEIKYPSNLAVVIALPVIILLVAGVEIGYRGTEILQAAGMGLHAALGGFLAWALGRELDPDRNAGAFVGMGLAVLAVLLGWAPALWMIATVLMATRLVNRTVGTPAHITDLGLITGLTAMAVFADGYWMVGVATAIAMAIDLYFDRSRTLNLVFAMIVTGFSAFAVVQADANWGVLLVSPALEIDNNWVVAMLTVSVLTLGMALTLPQVTSCADATGEPLNRRRIQGGVLVVLTIALVTGFSGQGGMLAALPVWAGLLGMIEARAMPKRKLG